MPSAFTEYPPHVRLTARPAGFQDEWDTVHAAKSSEARRADVRRTRWEGGRQSDSGGQELNS